MTMEVAIASSAYSTSVAWMDQWLMAKKNAAGSTQ
jgi:hypothetical protein